MRLSEWHFGCLGAGCDPYAQLPGLIYAKHWLVVAAKQPSKQCPLGRAQSSLQHICHCQCLHASQHPRPALLHGRCKTPLTADRCSWVSAVRSDSRGQLFKRSTKADMADNDPEISELAE